MASEARGCSTSRWRAWRAATPTTIDLLKNIRDSRDITMAMIEYDMHLVFSLAGRISVLARGTPLVEDTPEKIKRHPKGQEPCLGQALPPLTGPAARRLRSRACSAVPGYFGKKEAGTRR